MEPSAKDIEHVRLLAIFHYVIAGIAGLIGCFPIIHLVIGIMVLAAPQTFPGPQPLPRIFGLMFAIMASFMILAYWAYAICVLVAGRFLMRHRRYMFCLVIAGFSCLFFPFGTALGVFTIIVLLRPSVKELFGVAPAPST